MRLLDDISANNAIKVSVHPKAIFKCIKTQEEKLNMLQIISRSRSHGEPGSYMVR